MATMTVKLAPLTPPTHASFVMPPGLRQDGLQAAPQIRLTELPRETVVALCEELTAQVLKTWDAAQTAEVGDRR